MTIKGFYFGMDGSIFEETEVRGDTTTYIEWFGNGQKIGGKKEAAKLFS